MTTRKQKFNAGQTVPAFVADYLTVQIPYVHRSITHLATSPGAYEYHPICGRDHHGMVMGFEIDTDKPLEFDKEICGKCFDEAERRSKNKNKKDVTQS